MVFELGGKGKRAGNEAPAVNEASGCWTHTPDSRVGPLRPLRDYERSVVSISDNVEKFENAFHCRLYRGNIVCKKPLAFVLRSKWISVSVLLPIFYTFYIVTLLLFPRPRRKLSDSFHWCYDERLRRLVSYSRIMQEPVPTEGNMQTHGNIISRLINKKRDCWSQVHFCVILHKTTIYP